MSHFFYLNICTVNVGELNLFWQLFSQKLKMLLASHPKLFATSEVSSYQVLKL